MHIMIKDKRTGTEEWVQLDKAAELMGLAPEEIEWALEEFGECESEDHIATEPLHDHRAELAVHRWADEPARPEPAGALIDQQLAAEELMLMPITGNQRRSLCECRIEMLEAFDAHAAAQAPVQPDQPECQRHSEAVRKLAARSHASVGARDPPVNRVAQAAAGAAFAHGSGLMLAAQFP